MPSTQLPAAPDAIALRARVQAVRERGVIVVDPRQTFIDGDVEPQRVCAGATLHPGTRLHGARTLIGPGAHVGLQGPATLIDAVLGPDACVDAGYVEGAVLLDRARVGWGGHLRPGTILEEEASTAHAVGLKHTILFPFVTLGSLINFCDALIAGGTSRQDHSEVGSGFIHFNFTPWGQRGDKATPSLVGDVVRGVFLRSPRIFLGGSSGLVGPGQVGYGGITGAGQVVRRPVAEGHLMVEAPRAIDVARDPARLDRVEPRRRRNLEYIAQLVALRCMYRQVRRPRAATAAVHQQAAIDAALLNLDACIDERVQRLAAFLRERNQSMPSLSLDFELPCPLPVEDRPELDHVTWVQALDDEAVARGQAWLGDVVARVLNSAQTAPG